MHGRSITDIAQYRHIATQNAARGMTLGKKLDTKLPTVRIHSSVKLKPVVWGSTSHATVGTDPTWFHRVLNRES